MRSSEIISTCGICGDVVRSAVRPTWTRHRRALRALRDMQAHLNTHSFAELLRFEIRHDLDSVPDEQRPSIVRDVYRGLLGTTSDGVFALGAPDGVGVYTIDEALGDVGLHRLYQSAATCGLSTCRHT